MAKTCKIGFEKFWKWVSRLVLFCLLNISRQSPLPALFRDVPTDLQNGDDDDGDSDWLSLWWKQWWLFWWWWWWWWSPPKTVRIYPRDPSPRIFYLPSRNEGWHVKSANSFKMTLLRCCTSIFYGIIWSRAWQQSPTCSKYDWRVPGNRLIPIQAAFDHRLSSFIKCSCIFAPTLTGMKGGWKFWAKLQWGVKSSDLVPWGVIREME